MKHIYIKHVLNTVNIYNIEEQEQPACHQLLLLK